MSAADDRLLAEIAEVGAELATVTKAADRLKARRLKLFLRARTRSITTTRIAEAAGIEVGTVRQTLNRAKDGD